MEDNFLVCCAHYCVDVIFFKLLIVNSEIGAIGSGCWLLTVLGPVK